MHFCQSLISMVPLRIYLHVVQGSTLSRVYRVSQKNDLVRVRAMCRQYVASIREAFIKKTFFGVTMALTLEGTFF